MTQEVDPVLAGTRRVDWGSAYERHAGELLRYLARLVGERDAIDLLQDTFVEAMRHEGALRDHAALRAWLYRIATTRATRTLRRGRLVRFIPFSGMERSPEVLFDVEKDLVGRILRALPRDQAVVLVLRFQQGLSRSEIAVIVGASEGAVKTRIARGRANFVAAYRRLERGLKQ